MTKKKRPARSKKTKTAATHHARSGHDHSGAGWNLSVFIVPDDQFWYAQGVEMDYGAQGETVADARANFQRGFAATVKRHLAMFGDVDGLLKFTSEDLLKEAARNKAHMSSYSTRSLHGILDAHEQKVLPFEGLDFRTLRGTDKEPAREAAG